MVGRPAMPAFKKNTGSLIAAIAFSIGLAIALTLTRFTGTGAYTSVLLSFGALAFIASVGWTFIAYQNLRALGAETRMEPTLATVAVFVPIWSYFVKLELWRKSAPTPRPGVARVFSSQSMLWVLLETLVGLAFFWPAMPAQVEIALMAISLLLGAYLMLNITIRQRLRARERAVD